MTGQGYPKIKDTELDLLKNAEFKEAFDEFDKVRPWFKVVQNVHKKSAKVCKMCKCAQECRVQGGFR